MTETTPFERPSTAVDVGESNWAQLLCQVAVLWTVVGGCNTMSVIHKDALAGNNGGFESIEDGLPVNWYFISPEALDRRTYEVVMDTSDAVEGKHSLKFLVHETNPNPSVWLNPGMFNALGAIPGERYRVSFWLKTRGCRFQVKVRSENHPLEYEEVVVGSTGSPEEWQLFEHLYALPMEYDRMGLYLHIWTPGILWIDDVRIERSGEGEREY